MVNPNLFRDLRYDVLRDLTPVAMADLKPMVLVASPAFSANSLREVVAAAQAKAGPRLIWSADGKYQAPGDAAHNFQE